MNLEKLKDSARKFEQKEDWRKAIEVYLKAIQQIESGTETSPDLSLYNRVGDLYLKINDTAAAVRSYERAVDLYADQGFFNNAIALCGKILRVNPGRTQTYLKLAQLHARKNVVIEAKRNLIEFLERMNALGQLDQAFQSVKEFADQFAGSQEIRLMLVELLRAASRDDEALEQLAKIAGDLELRGGPPSPAPSHGEAHGSAPPAKAARPSSGAAGRGDLVFLDTGFGVSVPTTPAGSTAGGPSGSASRTGEPRESDPPPPEGLELTQLEPAAPESDGLDGALLPTDEPLAGLEPVIDTTLETGSVGWVPGLEVDLPPEDAPVDGMEIDTLEPGEGGSLEVEPAAGLLDVAGGLDLVMDAPDEDFAIAEPDLDMAVESSEADDAVGTPTAGLPLIDAPFAGDGLGDLEDRIADDPENPELHRELADRLLLLGDLPRAGEELRLSLEGYEQLDDWAGASAIADRLVAFEPDAIHHHQKRVELAFRTGERAPLLEAYLALGDALGRAGATEKALAVYGRVQEHDPHNERASAAIGVLSPPSLSSGVMSPPAMSPGARPAAPLDHEAAAEPETVGEAERVGDPPRSADAFVDLGSMILDDTAPRDTRMRVERREPRDEDEQREFKEILEQFKRGIEENLETDDYQAHYDLGVAFKEMGLLDEAIAEFQKALRAPEGRLRTSEALGTAFFEKGHFAVSEAVLRRAVDEVEAGDDAKIGLIYWLGRALEAQGRGADAVASYQRAVAVDIRFMDVGDRIQRLAGGRAE
ncbi:MAG: tetratricopeptide repeat protein [Gemmatimonadales bacterium]